MKPCSLCGGLDLGITPAKCLNMLLLDRGCSFPHLPVHYARIIPHYTGRFIMFSVITNIYNKKTKGPTLMELFTATGKLEKFFI
jgi:hypothetical protein